MNPATAVIIENARQLISSEGERLAREIPRITTALIREGIAPNAVRAMLDAFVEHQTAELRARVLAYCSASLEHSDAVH